MGIVTSNVPWQLLKAPQHDERVHRPALRTDCATLYYAAQCFCGWGWVSADGLLVSTVCMPSPRPTTHGRDCDPRQCVHISPPVGSTGNPEGRAASACATLCVSSVQLINLKAGGG